MKSEFPEGLKETETMKEKVEQIKNDTLKEQGENYVTFLDTINLRQ